MYFISYLYQTGRHLNMDFKDRFEQIRDYLLPYQLIWDREILICYPESIDWYDNEWIQDLSKLSLDEIFLIDSRKDLSPIRGSKFKEIIEKSIALSTIPKKLSCKNLDIPPHSLNRVSQKKRHELKNLIPVIEKVKSTHNIREVIDVGGGVGHLSRILAGYFDLHSTCIDYNKDHLNRGRQNLQKLRAPEQDKINFVHMDINKTPINEFNRIQNLFNRESFIVGLHSCGPLSVKLIKSIIHHKARGLINFGCCYLKCDPISDINLSKHASEKPLTITSEGLTLATRAHTELSRVDFDNKFRVKHHRYALHLFLYHELGQNKFLSVGDCNLSIYHESFSKYARMKLKQHGFKHDFSDHYLDNFYKKNETLLKKMFLCNLVRWVFGRPLELYILLDRVLYLQEHGYQTTINQYFDGKISPRNIGILSLYQ